MLGEIFYYHRQNEGLNIYDTCVAVPDLSIPYSRIFHLNNKSLVWPVSIDENVLMKSVELSNIGNDMDICSFYCTSWGLTGCSIYVGCKPKATYDHTADGTRCHIFVYDFTACEEVNYIQDMKVGYKPLGMSEFICNEGKYLFIVGSDKDIHVYEARAGRICRSTIAESIKATWKPLLGMGDSFCLRLLTENWGRGQQCVSGFADGYLYWHAISAQPNRSGSSDVPDLEEEEDLKLIAVVDKFWAAVLLDNAVTCIALYAPSRSFELRRRNLFGRLGVEAISSRCDIVVAGLANGSVLLLSSNSARNECTVLTGIDESPHGAVMALTIGDISGTIHVTTQHFYLILILKFISMLLMQLFVN